MPIKRRPPLALVLKENRMRIRHWLIRASIPAAALVASLGAGWKWEHFPH
jgi:hypothetical protein